MTDRWSQVAAVASAVAAVCALVVTLQERDTPYKSALYSARWNAIAEYARASAQLSSALERAAIAIPEAAESPATLAKMTDDQLLATASAARPTINAWATYIAAASAAGSPWSLETFSTISNAEKSGHWAYECFRWLGAYTKGEIIPPNWWSYMRKMAASHCDGVKHRVREQAFDVAAEMVLRAMTDELRKDDVQFIPGQPHNAMD